MEVIRPGVLPEPRNPPWPFNCTFACPECECLFRLEAGDDFQQSTERCLAGNSWVYVKCPTCHGQLTFDRKTYLATLAPINGMNK